MLNENKPYVQIPEFLNFSKLGVDYKDVAVYTAIRSFLNTLAERCFPCVTTIAKRVGASQDYVFDAIKRLELSGLIKVNRKFKMSNRYSFPDLGQTHWIPYDIFYCELGLPARAMLMCFRQFFYRGGLTCWDKLTDIIKKLGLSSNVVRKQYRTLVDNGYIEECFHPKIGKRPYKLILTDKLAWPDDKALKPAKILDRAKPNFKLKVS